MNGKKSRRLKKISQQATEEQGYNSEREVYQDMKSMYKTGMLKLVKK